jgi:hypothetical protein
LRAVPGGGEHVHQIQESRRPARRDDSVFKMRDVSRHKSMDVTRYALREALLPTGA